MRHALVTGLLIALAACGDNLAPNYTVDTIVGKTTFVAGERIDARCAVLGWDRETALDDAGNPIADQVELVIDYRHPDSFAADADGAVVAARVGTARVRCASPTLGVYDETPVDIEILPGAPVRVITQLDSETAMAGTTVGVSCLAFDAYNNPVPIEQQSVSISPFGAGTQAGTDTVSANYVGEYEVTCIVMGAADVEADTLVVLPGLPASIVGSLSPERTVYAIDDQVTVLAVAYDIYGNRVDDVLLAHTASPSVPSPSYARFQFAAEGAYTLTATVISPTHMGVALSVSLPVIVNSLGPAIQCMRIDAPNQPDDAYMVQRGPSTIAFPVSITDAFNVASVTINGTAATLNTTSGNYEAPISAGFGMNFVEVVATDEFGEENSTTCFVLMGEYFTPETGHMNGALALRLAQAAVGDSDPNGLNSLNDIFYTILGSDQIRKMVNDGLVAANPINDGGCGIWACEPDVTYNDGSISWDRPTSQLSLISGGLRARVTFRNVELSVRACGTTCCIGGSTIVVSVSSITATVDFSLTLQGGRLRTAVSGTPTVTVGTVALEGSGFCGFLIDLIESFVTDTVREAIRDALVSFINSDVGPMLDGLTSSLDVTTLAQSFLVPKLDGSGNITLNFGLSFSSFSATSTRALLGIGTLFSPATSAHSRPSLGIARRSANPLLDPPGTSSTNPVGVSFYEGALNQVLHGLWRGGFFKANLALGGGTATIDARLPAVASISTSQANLMLGGIAATITIPGVINDPLPIVFGGRAAASVTLSGNSLVFGNLTLSELHISFIGASITQNQRDALEDFLIDVLQDVLGSAINDGLPAFPIPAFTLPASASTYGLPGGAELGIVNPQLATTTYHYVLTGSFGVRN